MQKLIITEKGKEVISKLLSEESTITFTKIVLSDFDYGTTNLEKLISINNIKQTSLISSISKIDNSTVQITASIDNAELEERYYIKALGIYVEENGLEFLLAVSVELESPDCMFEYNGHNTMSLDYTINVKVDNASQVNLEINPSAHPTLSQVESKIIDDRPKVYKLTLSKENWNLNEETNLYDYRIDKVNITSNTLIQVLADKVNREKISDLDGDSYNGYFILTTEDEITEDVDVTIIYEETVPETSISEEVDNAN